jgi:adenylate cyclase class 2
LSSKDQEIEVKFLIRDLAALEKHLAALGAVLLQPVVRETNLRFDTPDELLSKGAKVLRLRQDNDVRLTYKGAGISQDGVQIRQELEIGVSDFNAARALLEALGYRVYMIYEKNRTTYSLGGTLVTEDVLPYGNFVEIEGPDAASIEAVGRGLGLNWEAGITESYTDLFARLGKYYGWEFRDLSFENFRGLTYSLAVLGIQPADLSN